MPGFKELIPPNEAEPVRQDKQRYFARHPEECRRIDEIMRRCHADIGIGRNLINKTAENIDVLEKNIRDDINPQEEPDEFAKLAESVRALTDLASVPEAKRAQKAALDILAKNFPALKLLRESYYEDYFLKAIYDLVRFYGPARYGKSEFMETIVSELIPYRNKLWRQLNIENESAAGCFDFLVANDPETHRQAIVALKAELKNPGNNRQGFVLMQSVLSGNKNLLTSRELAEDIMAEMLQDYGLNSNKFVATWRAGIPNRWDPNLISENLHAIQHLEKSRPGIAKFLNEKFGIYDFGRYPADALLRQYDQYDNTDSPYGVVFYPISDYNGAFFNSRDVFRNFFQKSLGHFEIRFAEGRNKLDIVRVLHRLNRQYGAKHKISFAIIGGHGTENSIQFGEGRNRDVLTSGDLADTRAEKTAYFEENPTFILVSCSTGTPGGVAQFLSHRLNATVIAPEQPTNISRINFKMEDGRPVFQVEYDNPRMAKTYASGESRDKQ